MDFEACGGMLIGCGIGPFLQPKSANQPADQTAMGNGGNAAAKEQHVKCNAGVHQCLFPMYLVKVSDFLQMEGVPEAHHSMKQQGLLHEWQPGMFVIFISHQWLGTKSPDPLGQQLGVLRHTLAAFINGSTQVEADLMRTFGDPKETTSYEQVADGYLFLDWFAIPQITARSDGVNDDITQSDAARAVQSIPAYVEQSDMFVALVPELLHADTGLRCNYTTWLSRGWCRAELWCRLLSNRRDTRVIVVFSAREALYILPSDWQRNLISDGMFTVESDRAVVEKLGEVALNSKIQCLQVLGPSVDYRFYLAYQDKLLNQTKQSCQDLPSFLHHFHFPSIEAAVKHESGMTGMLCAILGGDVEILQTLVQHHGDVNARVSGLAHLGFGDTHSLLMVAAASGQDAKMLQTLMMLHADPNVACISDSGSIVTASWLASHPSHVHVLLEKRADLAMSPPLTGVAGTASTETVQAFLEVRCDPTTVSENGWGPMYSTPFFGRGSPHSTSTMELLLSLRCDPNMQAIPRGLLYWECLRSRISASIWGLENCGVYQRQMASLPGATPLSIAAVMGDKALVEVLLEHDAQQIPNDRGDTPEDLARAACHMDLLPILSVFSV